MEENFKTRDRKRPLRSYVIRVPSPVVRSLCAWSLVLSLNASAPFSVLSADAATEDEERPVLHSTITPTKDGEPPVLDSAVDRTEDGESPVRYRTVTPTQDSDAPVLHNTIIPTQENESSVPQNTATQTQDNESSLPHNTVTPTPDNEASSPHSAVSPTQDNEASLPHSTVTPTPDGEAPVLHSAVTQNEYNRPPSPTVNKTDVREVAPGTALDLILLTGIEAGETAEGDQFTGKISKDVMVDGRVVIPTGTQVHGVLSTLEEPKRAGRNGYINARFDYLITPDGRKVSIEGNSTTRDSKGKAAAKVVGRAAGYTAIGGVVGTVIALEFGGLAGTVASHGTVLAGGAAIGGAAGLTLAMLMKGKSVMLQPGNEMLIKLSEPLKLPTMTMPDRTAEDYSLAGLKVKVLGMRTGRGEITLTLDILNETENTFSKFDICLEDELLGSLHFPSPLADGDRFSEIKPNSHVKSNITFIVESVKSRHKLVFFKPYSREPLAKFALTDAMLASGKATAKGKRVAAEARQPD